MKKTNLKLAALGAVLALGLGAATTASAATERTVELTPEWKHALTPQDFTFVSTSVAVLEGPDSTSIGTAPPEVSPGQP